MNLLFIDGELVETDAEAAANNEFTFMEEQADAPMTDAAQQTAPTGGGSFWIMIIAMIAVMYFFMWRPESKRRKQMENFRKGLKKGDKLSLLVVSTVLSRRYTTHIFLSRLTAM